MKKRILIVMLIAVLGLLGWQIHRQMTSSGKGRPNHRKRVALAVETQPVQTQTIRDVGLFTGTLQPRSTFIVAPKIAGRLEKLNVDIGDPVDTDQLIAVLDNNEYIQQVDQARAEKDVAEANLEETHSALEIAQRELERVEALRQKKIASESELDAARAKFKAQSAKHKVAVAHVAQKQAALKAAKVRLSYTEICVTCGGKDEKWVVGERFVDEGAMLVPNSSIVSVLEIGALIAVIHVTERSYPKVRMGQSASVTTDAFPTQTFTGNIVRVAPLLKETSREARVEIELPNPDGLLKPGMFVRVQIEFAQHPEVTVIPYDALVKRDQRQGVFLADPQAHIARFVPVTIGIVNNKLAEVIDPPLSGAVVTLGQHLLEDGSAILLPNAKPGPDAPAESGPHGTPSAAQPKG